jgi:large subunit ribosomal protein L24
MAKVKAKAKSKSKLKIRKDDDVIVISGRDKGKRGKVLRVLPAKKRVLVEGVAMARRHVKPSQTEPQGGIVEREATIHLSNVALVDPASELPTRAGYKVLEDGRKVRFARRSGEVIDV